MVRITRSCWTTFHRVVKTFESLHVEFQGYYSRERLHQLSTYTSTVNRDRMWLLCMLTPVPCLVVSLLVEAVPLPPPQAGVLQNWFLFVRSWVLIALINITVLVQIGQGAPRLKMTVRQVASISLLAATVSIVFIISVCRLVVFPFPFGFLVVAPPDVCVVAVCFVYTSGPQLRAEPSLWVEIKQQLSVFYCQVALTFVYPLYVYGLVSLSGIAQAGFVLLSPIIQLVAKNWINQSLTNHDDIKPETVVFIVEIFSAVYASNALQSVSSWKTTLLVVLTDHLQFWVAMLDIAKLLNELKLLMSKIPRSHPMARENFVQIAERLRIYQANNAQRSRINCPESHEHIPKNSWAKAANTVKILRYSQRKTIILYKKNLFFEATKDPKRFISRKARVFPFHPPHNIRDEGHELIGIQAGIDTVADVAPGLKIEALFSREDRSRFIKTATQVLYVTEHIVLVEYIEVVMPIIFSKLF
ncbi:unnamed protein product [Phytophthora fragariaefolia]|uniref:Unnamed protein product n=1 Tax=Phytophthora fragariaefolia TaxID=1490495 RepID=A0A9W6XK69_9STRA|nr:unnamed protein product [Phytophthora fragariaefolia]